jgi:hypothetical protein
VSKAGRHGVWLPASAFEPFAFLVLLHVARAMAVGGFQDDSVLLSVDVVVSTVKYNLYSVVEQ